MQVNIIIPTRLVAELKAAALGSRLPVREYAAQLIEAALARRRLLKRRILGHVPVVQKPAEPEPEVLNTEAVLPDAGDLDALSDLE